MMRLAKEYGLSDLSLAKICKNGINDVRRSLLKMTPDYTLEFIWIMSKYKACTRADIEGLMGTPAMKSLISGHLERVKELIASFPKVDEIAADGKGGP
jgi:hypothetical protein